MFCGNHDGNGMRFGDSGSAARFFYGIPEENKLQGLVAYLHKLITPPGGKTMWLIPPEYVIQ